jgi:dihydrofolate reductase
VPNELFVQIFVSLDGYIEDAEQSLEWMAFDASLDPFLTQVLRSIDAMIFGRRAHALLHGFWPGAAETPGAGPELIEQARLMNALPKYVLTRGKETTGWANSHAIRLDEIPALKAGARRPIALFAGASAAQAALQAGVVDEIRLIQQPVMLGAGTPLFASSGRRRKLALLESRSFGSGAVLSRYRSADTAADRGEAE